MATFTCQTCGNNFELRDEVLERYPGWKPKTCMRCKKANEASAAREGGGASGGPPGRPSRSGKKKPRSGGSRKRSATAEQDLPLAEVLATYTDGPESGVFTDGAADPNPGPGGWGAVYVVGGEVLAQEYGHEPHTTNNRMELAALIAGYKLVPEGTAATVYTDSQLCVNTITKWAHGWKKAGWKRKTGPIKNLELVQELYELAQSRPDIRLEWIKAHSGYRWNEYADSLATAYRRSTL